MNRVIESNVRVALVLVLVGVLAAGALPVTPVAAQEDLVLEIGKVGHLVDGGEAVEVQIRVRCALEDMEVLESLVYVVQDGNTSDFASLPVTCGDQPQMQVLTVRLSAVDFVFVRGAAQVSAYLLLVDPETQETVSLSPTATITIR